MLGENIDPKEKPRKSDDPDKRKNQEEGNGEDEQEFPDLYEDQDEDFDDPDEQEFI